MIVGLPGQSRESFADGILLAREYGVHMCSASPFVPAPGTPLEGQPYGSMDVTLNALALMRIVSPGWLVPSVSALEKTREDGQLDGLNAGADVITINFTDEAHRGQYLIYGRDRFIVRANYARELVARAGLVPSQSVFVGSGKFEPAAYEIDSGRGGDNLSRRASTQTAAASSRSSFPAPPNSASPRGSRAGPSPLGITTAGTPSRVQRTQNRESPVVSAGGASPSAGGGSMASKPSMNDP